MEEDFDWEKKNDSDRGLVFVHDSTAATGSYAIVSATASNIVIRGILAPTAIAPAEQGNPATCNTFGLIYGQLIRDVVSTPNSGSKNVKFFDPNGGFVDGNNEGICQVCHTATFHFRNTGEVNTGAGLFDHTGETDSNCTDCHSHTNAFAHGGNGGSCGTTSECHGTRESHPTHVAGSGMVGVDCDECHNINNFPEFKDGENLVNTNACDNCHGGGLGVTLAKQYWESPGSSNVTAGSWAVVLGEISFCGSCHDSTPGNTLGNGAGDVAFNVMGDNSTYGFSITGHGKVSGNCPPMYYQAGAGVGNNFVDVGNGDFCSVHCA